MYRLVLTAVVLVFVFILWRWFFGGEIAVEDISDGSANLTAPAGEVPPPHSPESYIPVPDATYFILVDRSQLEAPNLFPGATSVSIVAGELTAAGATVTGSVQLSALYADGTARNATVSFDAVSSTAGDGVEFQYELTGSLTRGDDRWQLAATRAFIYQNDEGYAVVVVTLPEDGSRPALGITLVAEER